MREKLRDKTRDTLAERLNTIGVTATLSERGRPEEKVGNRRFRRSLGIIDIADEGLVKWINIIKQDRQTTASMVVLPWSSYRQTTTEVTICEHQNKTQEIVPSLRKDHWRYLERAGSQPRSSK